MLTQITTVPTPRTENAGISPRQADTRPGNRGDFRAHGGYSFLGPRCCLASPARVTSQLPQIIAISSRGRRGQGSTGFGNNPLHAFVSAGRSCACGSVGGNVMPLTLRWASMTVSARMRTHVLRLVSQGLSGTCFRWTLVGRWSVSGK